LEETTVDDARDGSDVRPGKPTKRMDELVGTVSFQVCFFCTDPECENPLFCESHETKTDESLLKTTHIDGTDTDLNIPIQDMWGNALFSQHTLLLIDIEGVTSSFVLHPTDRILLGRADARHTSDNFLDLTPYGAHSKGVSRTHATINQSGHTLMLTDLGSSNGTFINELRVMPNQPRILRDGDMVRLGRLVAYVRFK
jgi:hypothetical protein